MIVQNVQAVQPLRSVQIVLQPKNKFQSFHRLRGSKRNHYLSLAKEISPTGEGVNHVVKSQAWFDLNELESTVDRSRSLVSTFAPVDSFKVPLDVKDMPTKIFAMIRNLAVYLGRYVFAGGIVIQTIACATGTQVYTIPAGTDVVKPVPLGTREYGPILDAIVSVMVRDLKLPAPTGSVTVYPSQASYEEGALVEAREDLERLRRQLGPKASQLKEEEFLFGAKRTAVSSGAHARYKKVLVNERLLGKNSWAGQLRLLAHELTHVMQMDLVDGRSITSDQWIREGFAEWVGYKVAEALGAESFDKGRERALALIAERKFYQTFPSLSQLALNSEWLTWSRTLGNSGTYGQAFTAVDFLITEKGLPAVINYFQLFKKLNNRGRNFATAFGEPTATFEERFAKHLDHLLRK